MAVPLPPPSCQSESVAIVANIAAKLCESCAKETRSCAHRLTAAFGGVFHAITGEKKKVRFAAIVLTKCADCKVLSAGSMGIGMT